LHDYLGLCSTCEPGDVRTVETKRQVIDGKYTGKSKWQRIILFVYPPPLPRDDEDPVDPTIEYEAKGICYCEREATAHFDRDYFRCDPVGICPLDNYQCGLKNVKIKYDWIHKLHRKDVRTEKTTVFAKEYVTDPETVTNMDNWEASESLRCRERCQLRAGVFPPAPIVNVM
jgi:hypothetical protein